MIILSKDGKPLQVDGFKVLSTIGKGGFGTLLKVSKEGNLFAMKFLKSAHEIHCINEHLDVLKILNTSPLFIQTYFSKRIQSSLYIVMEYIDSKNLKVIKEVDIEKFLSYMIDVLKFFHKNSMIHGDIKDENILISSNYFYLIDYDLATFAKESRLIHLYQDFNYIAPEQFYGIRSQKSDIYSFGLTLYKLRYKKFAYDINCTENFAAKMFAHLYKNLQFEYFDWLDYLIFRMTQKYPKKRADINEIVTIFHDKIVGNFESNLQMSTNFQNEAECYLQMAEDGVPYAQNILGIMYEEGDGVLQDSKKAFFWYNQATQNGLVKAIFNLALCYYNAKGVVQNLQKAKELFYKAANLGHARSYYYLWELTKDISMLQKSAYFGFKPAYKELIALKAK